jgi:CheY-like chemotaxis protein
MVEQAGYDCDACADGEQALELVQKHSYFLVMMDLVMSPMDGWTTTKKIRASLFQSLGFTSSTPKIVAVTGLQIDEKLSKQCKDAGMDDVVQKPITPQLLSKALHKHSFQPAMKLDR